MRAEEWTPGQVAVAAEDYRHAISRLPTAATVITTLGPAGPVGCTANAVMSLSLKPPSVLLSLATTSRTLADVQKTGRFAVNVLTWSDRRLIRQFATGDCAERFADVPWHEVAGVPVLTRASVTVVCAVRDAVPVLDHTLVIGHVVWTKASDTPPSVLYGNGQHVVGL
jgi:flavin reductase (DIM6/NTAB) family NADH-FMN oxidoreductase RutF